MGYKITGMGITGMIRRQEVVLIITVATILLNGSSTAIGMDKKPKFIPKSEDECAQRILKSADIYDEGRAAELKGDYNTAIQKYKDAVSEAYRPVTMDCGQYDSTSMARGGIRRVFEKQHRFEEAIEAHKWFLEMNPEKEPFQDKEAELNALLSSQRTGSNELVVEHIVRLENNYRNYLPPVKYGTYSVIVATDIIRLYDFIADYEGGITFIDKILVYPELDEKTRQEYQKVKVAFEQDKAESTRGRATKALIQSDYFPW